ncbi:MAG TPA: class I SAM-dependent methyltransferase [Fibrobacteraceae bacterium]|nr:class I SAM-dependent methyltransferase [Fibrobacteraceae bacterium]
MQNQFDQNAANWDAKAYRVDRARIIAQKILARIPVQPHFRMMDFGCGTGLLGFHFVDKAREVVFADTSQGMLEQVIHKADKMGVHNIQALNLSSQEPDGEYDLIVSLLALHHVEDHEQAIRDLTPLLTPGGVLAFCDLDNEDGSFHGDTLVPHNGFDRSEIMSIYRSCGLTAIQATTAFVDKGKNVGRAYPMFLIQGVRPQ